MSDLINRQDAIDELDKGAWGVEWDKALAKTMIESLPSAERIGHWIMKTITVGFPDWFCSECGKSGRGDYQYCPWCGADMRGWNNDKLEK